MIRHLLIVLVSALFGSVFGTLVWVGFEGGTGAPDPARFIAGFALFTLMFTLPGCIFLAWLSLVMADRGLSLGQATAVLFVLGSVAGAVMLAIFRSPYFMALGAIYGGLTTIAFLTGLRLLSVYAERSR